MIIFLPFFLILLALGMPVLFALLIAPGLISLIMDPRGPFPQWAWPAKVTLPMGTDKAEEVKAVLAQASIFVGLEPRLLDQLAALAVRKKYR